MQDCRWSWSRSCHCFWLWCWAHTLSLQTDCWARTATAKSCYSGASRPPSLLVHCFYPKEILFAFCAFYGCSGGDCLLHPPDRCTSHLHFDEAQLGFHKSIEGKWEPFRVDLCHLARFPCPQSTPMFDSFLVCALPILNLFPLGVLALTDEQVQALYST